MHNFEKLKVWQKSMNFVTEIYKATAEFPPEERFGLISQIRRAAVTISLNISEGAGSGTDPEFVRFLRIALRSCYEVITGLEVARRLGYGDPNELENLKTDADEIAAMIGGLIKTLSKS